jgi:hypothetical protein
MTGFANFLLYAVWLLGSAFIRIPTSHVSVFPVVTTDGEVRVSVDFGVTF